MSLAHFTEVLFIGFFTAAGLYGGLLFLMTRDRAFLSYAALMDAMAAAQLVFAPDLVARALHGSSPALYRSLALAAFFIAETAFAWSFLQLRSRQRNYAAIVSSLLALNLIALAVQYVYPREPFITAGHVLFLALLALCGAAAWESATSGTDDARYYVVAFAGAFLGAFSSGVAQGLGLINWPEYFFQFGIAWQGAVLALAMASRYTKIDPLTGAKSREAFEERLAATWRVARKRRSGLAVIMVAAGGLKEYDSRHGRIAGDALLRELAGACVAACGDRLDLFARYGDEAFAAIITRVSRAQADDIARRLGADIADQSLLTVGIGVASNENAISAEALAQQAARRSARDAIKRAVTT